MEDHPHLAEITIKYDWKGQKEHPDSMKVIAVRTINMLKYVFEVTSYDISESIENTGQILLHPKGEEPKFMDEDDESSHVLELHSGEYRMITFNGGDQSTNFDLERFEKDNSYTLNSVQTWYNTEERPSDSAFIDWTDRNLYSGYIKEGQPRAYLAASTIKVPTTASSDTLKYEITFSPQCLNQTVLISFDIETEPGIHLDRVLADISGIPDTIYIGSGQMQVSKTCKTVFKPTITDSIPLPAGGYSYHCTSQISVIGIVPSQSQALTTGPGIMQVNIHASYADANHYLHHRVYIATINLYETLHAHPSLEKDDFGNTHQTDSVLHLQLDQVMRINQDGIKNSNTGMDQWIDYTPHIGIDF